MRYLILSSFCFSLFFSHTAHCADTPKYIGQHKSTPEDLSAIHQVIENFQTAIKSKDRKLLSTLVLGDNILFSSPQPPGAIKMAREKIDVNFNGINSNGYEAFARFISSSKNPNEEKFYNIKVTQDGNIAWVQFDYEFINDQRSSNYGIEVWQMLKSIDGSWKIFSVVWSVNLLPE
ncbi:MAG: nuclear transport factor 2 family protein [Undibacterium sp.]|nr:nuclear transport factor 2 family protein [Undibacterium sp.]